MLKVLFIEDNQALVDGLMPWFKLQQLDVVHAPTIQVARGALLQGPYVAIVLDIQLPDGNGISLCQQIHDAFPTLP